MDVLLFGIAKDIVGRAEIKFAYEGMKAMTVREFKVGMVAQYPALGKLTSFAVAVNSEYATDDVVLDANDEVAIIPPVSGG